MLMKVLTIYKTYLNSPPPSFSFIPYSWNSFNKSYFYIYIHVYTIFAPYLLSYTLSPHSLHSHWHQPPKQDLPCPLVLCICKKKISFAFYICIIIQIGSSPLFFSLISKSMFKGVSLCIPTVYILIASTLSLEPHPQSYHFAKWEVSRSFLTFLIF
jgi:hypothetical protein